MTDRTHHTMYLLLVGIERKMDPQNLRVLRAAMLRSAFNHLFSAQLECDIDDGVGFAMCELLVLAGDRT